jgi:acetolactate synthase small subunit
MGLAAMLERLLPIHKVTDLTLRGNAVERELAMIKIVGKGADRDEALRLAEAFRARAICASMESFVFELASAAGNIDPFINLMRSIGLVVVSRTSVAAMSRGPNATLGRASPRLASQYLFRKMSLPFRRSGSSRDFGRHRQA